MLTPEQFATRLLEWFDQHGRHDLPWQHPRTPYRVWLSEIMLQQTQVSTVIPYFERFEQRFPDVHALAAATDDEVMRLWAGLGYYARARNLKKAAERVSKEFAGDFPETVDALSELPGIGRSTAGAVRSLGFGKRAAILDGNVKRVLARVHSVDGWPGKSSVLAQLWEIAERLTPDHRVSDYNQAMMDLGALLCTRSKPDCKQCPFETDCTALASGTPERFPGKKPRKVKPQRATLMLIVRHQDSVLLERRPPTGIWGGLWSLPEVWHQPADLLESDQPNDAVEVVSQTPSRFELPDHADFDSLSKESAVMKWLTYQGLRIDSMAPQSVLRHSFSHYDLDIEPLVVTIESERAAVNEPVGLQWFGKTEIDAIGLPAPVAKLVNLYVA